MKTKIALLASALLTIPFLASAFSNVSADVSQMDLATPYWKDFDVLALEFELDAPSDDSLNTVTLTASGTARYGDNREYSKLTLWADAGDDGFQGYGYDTNLGDAELFSSHWVFDDIDYQFTGAQKFYVSLETGTLLEERILQLILDDGSEIEEDGIWQDGETGVFLDSGVIEDIANPAYTGIMSFKSSKVDTMPPKAFINSLSVQESDPTLFINPDNGEITLTGESKDRGGSNVTDVKVIFNGVEIDATQTSEWFGTWEVSYIPPIDNYNDFVVYVKATAIDKDWTSGAYHLIYDNREVNDIKSTLVVDKNEAQADGIDQIVFTATVKDEDGNLLANREIDFDLYLDNVLIATLSDTTDINGEAQVSSVSETTGELEVRAKYDNVQFASETSNFVEYVEPQPEPTPEPEEEEEETTIPYTTLVAGDLIKGPETDAVYYYSEDLTRHVFENVRVYKSWYGGDFSKVKTISKEQLASIKLGRSVNYRPGELIKTPSLYEVYVVTLGGELRHLGSESIAKQIYGDEWSKLVHDISESLLFTYTFGEVIDDVSDFNLDQIKGMSLTIDDEL